MLTKATQLTVSIHEAHDCYVYSVDDSLIEKYKIRNTFSPYTAILFNNTARKVRKLVDHKYIITQLAIHVSAFTTILRKISSM